MTPPDVAPLLKRRMFLAASGASILVAGGHTATAHGSPRCIVQAGARRDPANPWLEFTQDGRVCVLVDKCEMGQGVRHMFATIVAEALGLTPRAIEVRDAPVDPKRYGNRHIVPTVGGIELGEILQFQATGRSSSAADMWSKLREAAMATRARTPRTTRATAGTEKTPPILGDQTAWRPRIDACGKVTGEARFGIDLGAEDLRRDGLPASPFLIALVCRPSRVGDAIDLDHPETRAHMQIIKGMPGVRSLVPLDEGRGGVAIVADSFWHAIKAKRRFSPRERARDGALAGSAAILRAYEDGLDQRTRELDGAAPSDSGPSAGSTAWRTYVTPFGPHAALEPLSAVCARDGSGGYHIYAATQFPQSARAQAADVLGAPVAIHGQIAGGAFGRRTASDFIVEAARIARALSRNMPEVAVKLMWTREDDFRHDYLRPCAASRVRAAVTDQRITSWEHLVISESPNLALTDEYVPALPLGTVVGWLPNRWKKWRRPRHARLDLVDFTIEEGLTDSVYEMAPTSHLLDIPGLKPSIYRTVRIGYWRSVGCFHTIFAVESMLDELAWERSTNPLAIRICNLQRPGLDPPQKDRQARMLWCVQQVAALAEEQNLQKRGTGYGMACLSGWDSFAALVVQVKQGDQDPREIRVGKAWAAVDCGFVLNPDVLDQQVEGGIIFGLSAALKQEITTMNGVVRETNFHACDSLRIDESPTIQVVQRPWERPTPEKPPSEGPGTPKTPTGVGELVVPLPAPAIANAVFNLTGRRYRRVPLGSEASR